MWPFRKKCKHPRTTLWTSQYGIALTCGDCGINLDSIPMPNTEEYRENELLQDPICGKHHG